MLMRAAEGYNIFRDEKRDLARFQAYVTLVAVAGSDKIKYENIRLPGDPEKKIKLSRIKPNTISKNE